MEFETGIGLGLYVAGLILLMRTIEESLPLDKRKTGRWASIITFILLGWLLMVYG